MCDLKSHAATPLLPRHMLIVVIFVQVHLDSGNSRWWWFCAKSFYTVSGSAIHTYDIAVALSEFIIYVLYEFSH